MQNITRKYVKSTEEKGKLFTDYTMQAAAGERGTVKRSKDC